MCAYIHTTHIEMCIYTHVHMCMYVCVYTYVYTHTHTHCYIQVYAYAAHARGLQKVYGFVWLVFALEAKLADITLAAIKADQTAEGIILF